MESKKSSKEVLIIGFAVFAMFFGAGNIIFPPTLGLQAGTKYLTVMAGFLITGVGLPLMGIISAAKAGGKMDSLLGKVSPMFARLMGLAITLAIGPLYAIPRTAAMTHEMTVLPLMPGASNIIVNLIYFVITYLLVANPTTVVDNIGKFLTPALLAMLAIIIVKGVMTPIGSPVVTPNEAFKTFGYGFNYGYQTMDGIVSIIFVGIIIKELESLGIKRGKQQLSMTLKAGLIAIVLLGLIYIGLSHLGATASGVIPQDTERVALLKQIVQTLLGNFGKIALGLAVGLACLTTSIGLVASTADYFNEMSKNRVSYKTIVIIICVFSYFLSLLGVDGIISVVAPILGIIYPPAMVVILLNLLPSFLHKRGVFIAAVVGAFLVSITEGLSTYMPALAGRTNFIPLGKAGFAWITVSVICGIIGYFIAMSSKNSYMGQDVSDQVL